MVISSTHEVHRTQVSTAWWRCSKFPSKVPPRQSKHPCSSWAVGCSAPEQVLQTKQAFTFALLGFRSDAWSKSCAHTELAFSIRGENTRFQPKLQSRLVKITLALGPLCSQALLPCRLWLVRSFRFICCKWVRRAVLALKKKFPNIAWKEDHPSPLVQVSLTPRGCFFYRTLKYSAQHHPLKEIQQRAGVITGFNIKLVNSLTHMKQLSLTRTLYFLFLFLCTEAAPAPSLLLCLRRTGWKQLYLLALKKENKSSWINSTSKSISEQAKETCYGQLPTSWKEMSE